MTMTSVRSMQLKLAFQSISRRRSVPTRVSSCSSLSIQFDSLRGRSSCSSISNSSCHLNFPTTSSVAQYLSTAAAAATGTSSAADNPTTGSKRSGKDKKLTLRRLSAPFLLLCHPDKIPASSETLREVNLRATQTLNGLISTVEELCKRSEVGTSTDGINSSTAGRSTDSTVGERIELKARYEVEFLVPSENGQDVGRKKRKGDCGKKYTRRSVVISFPRSLRDSLQTVDSSGRYSESAASAVRRKVSQDIVRILKVAGATVPDGADSAFDTNQREDAAYTYGRDDALFDEINITNSSQNRFGGNTLSRTRPMTHYEQSRAEFMRTTDWKEHRRKTEEALKDAEADMATRNVMAASQRRREHLVSNLLAKVTIDSKGNNLVGRDCRSDEEKGLDPLHQLIAFRRLSLILTDNFDYLQMESMGKLWEKTSIVLTPARRDDHSSEKDKYGNTIVLSSAAYGIPRRQNPLFRGQESGFKFVYAEDGAITVHVPIDFSDGDLVSQLHSNVWDVFNQTGDGLEEYFPSYMRNH